MSLALSKLVDIGYLSFGDHRTLHHTLQHAANAGLNRIAGQGFIYFNSLTAEDHVISKEYGFECYGDKTNSGIYGGFRSIAEISKKPYILILENDIYPLLGHDIENTLKTCLSDMIEYQIPVFCLRSRSQPGQGSVWRKYFDAFGVKEPVSAEIKDWMQQHSFYSQPHRKKRHAHGYILTWSKRLKMHLKHGYLSKFIGSSIYAEKRPDVRWPNAITKKTSGNYVTDSRYRNWSNQALLVNRAYFLDVICKRVLEHPDPRLVHGYQDIERALNTWWWRKQKVLLGHHSEGCFTHHRLQ